MRNRSNLYKMQTSWNRGCQTPHSVCRDSQGRHVWLAIIASLMAVAVGFSSSMGCLLAARPAAGHRLIKLDDYDLGLRGDADRAR